MSALILDGGRMVRRFDWPIAGDPYASAHEFREVGLFAAGGSRLGGLSLHGSPR